MPPLTLGGALWATWASTGGTGRGGRWWTVDCGLWTGGPCSGLVEMVRHPEPGH